MINNQIFEWILTLTAFIGTGIASYIDLTREDRIVPDIISYSMIFIALFVKGVQSYFNYDYWILLNSCIVGGLFFGFGALMYYGRQWGGGDTKILASLGFLLSSKSFNIVSPLPFPLLLFLILLFAEGLWGTIYLSYLLFKNEKLAKKVIKVIKSKKWESISVFSLSLGISIPFIISKSGLALFGPLILFLWFLARSAKVVEDFMIVDKNIDELVEGDVPYNKIKVDGKIIATKRNPGLNEEQLNKLKELKEEGKIEKVKIKEGIPNIPSFLIGLFMTLILGNIISKLLTGV